jgi:cytosine/uracil/thiamine/allantoin permease
MKHPTNSPVVWSGTLGRRIAYVLVSLVYYLYRLLLTALMCLPLGMFIVVSGLLLDPAIPGSARSDIQQLVLDGFEQIFYYTVAVSILLSLAVLFLEPLKAARRWLAPEASTESK